MSQNEMDDLALLWSQAAAPEEEQSARRFAERVGWRARLLRYADYGAAIAIGGGIAVLMLMRGNGATGLSALLFVTALGWVTWKRQALWDVEMSAAAAGSETLLEARAVSTQARLKRANVSLFSLVPIFILGLWFGFGLYRPDMDSLAEVGAYMQSDLKRTAVALGILVLLVLWLLRSRRMLKRELERIEAMREQYREEARIDSAADPAPASKI